MAVGFSDLTRFKQVTRAWRAPPSLGRTLLYSWQNAKRPRPGGQPPAAPRVTPTGPSGARRGRGRVRPPGEDGAPSAPPLGRAAHGPRPPKPTRPLPERHGAAPAARPPERRRGGRPRGGGRGRRGGDGGNAGAAQRRPPALPRRPFPPLSVPGCRWRALRRSTLGAGLRRRGPSGRRAARPPSYPASSARLRPPHCRKGGMGLCACSAPPPRGGERGRRLAVFRRARRLSFAAGAVARRGLSALGGIVPLLRATPGA